MKVINSLSAYFPFLYLINLVARKLLLTNAAGGINENFKPGDLMLALSFNGINLKYELTNLLGLSDIETKNQFSEFSIFF